jgi:predicted transport protein
MGSLKLFRTAGGQAQELDGESAPLEKTLQNLIEANMETLLGVRFLESEFVVTKPKGRIDSLGLDENGFPVIVEYKRYVDQNVITQGLFYLDWLLDHRADFQLLVTKVLGAEVAETIAWGGTRLMCIAGDFGRYDEHAVQQIDRNIELIRYRRFEGELLLLEAVNGTSSSGAGAGSGSAKVNPTSPAQADSAPKVAYKTIEDTLASLEGELGELYAELRDYLLELGDDVEEKTLKYYVAFKRLKNFACVEVYPSKGRLSVYLKVDPGSVPLEDGFTRDVSQIGHLGTGDLEVSLYTTADLEKAKPLIQESYDAS